ncbi:MAG: hypothetical protein PHV59_05720 [Victivallales bacterium]|nr:hypothetical protein [Victivallales bacterium]
MSASVVISSIVMFAALVGMIICSKKQKTNPGAQPIAIALLIVVIISGGFILYKKNVFGNSNRGIIEAEKHFYAAQGYVIGKFVKDNMPGAKVLLIENRNYEKSDREQQFIDAFKKSVNAADLKVVSLQPPADPNVPEDDMGMMGITSKNFDKIISENPSCNVIVAVTGLPYDANRMEFWRMAEGKRPKLVLANGIGGGSIKLAKAIEQGAVSAVVVVSPKANFETEDAPSDFEDAFKERYILVTKANRKENLNSIRE